MPHHPTAIFASVLLILSAALGTLEAASIRFVTLNDEIASREISFKDSKGTTKLKNLSAQKRTAAYTFTSGKKPLLLIAADRKNAGGDPESLEIALTAENKAPLVLILPDAQHPSGLKAITIDDSAKGFPWGSLRFLNTSGTELTIRYEKETKPLPQGDSLVDIVPGGDARNVGVQLFEEKAPTVILYSAVWEHDPNVRKLIFVVPGTDPAARAFDLIVLPEDQRVKK